MPQTRSVQGRARVHRTEHKGYVITVASRRNLTSCNATASLKPPLKNGVRNFTILGAKSSRTAQSDVLQWAKGYIDQHSS